MTKYPAPEVTRAEGIIVTRDMRYRLKTLRQLIGDYAFEVDRIDQEDKEATQRAIVNEVYIRIKDMFSALDRDPASVDRIYKQLINF